VPRLPELRFDEWLQLSGGTRTMAIRDKIAANAQPHLQPGEQIQGVFSAQTMSQWWILLTIFILLFGNRYRPVVATDRRILVFDSGRWTTTQAKSLVRELPRQTPLGEPSGLWWRTESLGERLYVHKRYHKDVREIQAGAVAAGPAVGRPLPPPGT
jgi:hypothetical protein